MSQRDYEVIKEMKLDISPNVNLVPGQNKQHGFYRLTQAEFAATVIRGAM